MIGYAVIHRLYLSIYSATCIYLSINPFFSINLLFYLSIYLSIHLSIYRIARNVCQEFNFSVCGFLGNPQAFLVQKFLTCNMWQYCVSKQQTLIWQTSLLSTKRNV